MRDRIKIQMKIYDETGRRRDMVEFFLRDHWSIEDAQDWMQRIRDVTSAETGEVTHGITH